MNDGYRTKATELGATGFPVLRVAEVKDGYIEPSFQDHVRSEFRPKIGVKLAEPRDVVVTTKGTVGRVAQIADDSPTFVYSPQVCFFRVTGAGVDPGWLYQWARSPEFVAQATGVQGQTDMAAYINLTDLKRMHVSLPDMASQRGIAATLGALDNKIESNRRLLEMLEREAALLFAELFDVGQLPDGMPLSELVDVNPPRRLAGGTESAYIGMSALPVDRALIETVERKPAGSGQRFTNGDVLMARITPCLENGKTAVVDVLDDGEVGWGSTEFIVLAPRSPLTTSWVYCLARTAEVRAFAIRSMSGTSGRQRFSASAFGNYGIAQPNVEAVHQFNAVAEPAFTKMGQLRDESRRLADLRDALLPELMSGRIRVPEAGEAVDSVV